jgi:hypothetical protein
MTHGYIAYIDESGDDGLRHAAGSLEWFVLAAVVIRADREGEILKETRRIRSRLSRVIRPEIHFRFLREENKILVCNEIAGLNVRAFVVISNKKNMLGYYNPRASAIWSRNYFYCWMVRLLLERVTAFCENRSPKDFNAIRSVKIVFSHRGGFSYAQFRAYLHKLREQSRGSTLYLDRGDLKWSVVDLDEITSADHRAVEPLQLADCVAGAFYEAVTVKSNGRCNPAFAKLLQPRMWAPRSVTWKNGVMAVPFNLRDAELLSSQREIFDY